MEPSHIETYHTILTYILLSTSSLCIGSFLNVVIYRLPIMLKGANDTKFNLAIPRSHCPQCQYQLHWHDNIPLVSWLLLHGRCRKCCSSIPLRYFLVELMFFIATLVCISRYDLDINLFAALLLSWSLLVLALIDYEHYLLPDKITLPLLWAGLLYNISGINIPIEDGVLGAVAGYMLLWLVYWGYRISTGKKALGYGDFKFLAALGAWLGWQRLPTLVLIASVMGIAITSLSIVFKYRSKKEAIPYGPYLALSGWVMFLFPSL